jgi:hypothetical protein
MQNNQSCSIICVSGPGFSQKKVNLNFKLKSYHSQDWSDVARAGRMLPDRKGFSSYNKTKTNVLVFFKKFLHLKKNSIKSYVRKILLVETFARK